MPWISCLFREKLTLLDMDEKLMNRSVNEGFSGGEKKRNEILQMAVLEPKLAILDETDSGLDIDALRIVAQGVDAMRNPERAIRAAILLAVRRSERTGPILLLYGSDGGDDSHGLCAGGTSGGGCAD